MVSAKLFLKYAFIGICFACAVTAAFLLHETPY